MPYDVDKDPYSDSDLGILLNLLGLKTEIDLQDAETRLSSLEIAGLMAQKSPPLEAMNANMLQL